MYLQLGEWENSQATLNDCFNLIAKIPNNQTTAEITASVLEVKGQLELSVCKPESALDTWKESGQIYKKFDNFIGFTRSSINQAQA